MDTAHVATSRRRTPENPYVSITRGSEVNTAYVALDLPDEAHVPLEPDDLDAGSVLFGVLKRSGAELSAQQALGVEQVRWSSIAQLGADYETIAAVAQRDRGQPHEILCTDRGAARLGHRFRHVRSTYG